MTADYHQQNLINDFTPLLQPVRQRVVSQPLGRPAVGVRIAQGFDWRAHYKRSGITRSNASLWPQIYSIDNMDLLTVVPSSFSNTAGLALRYHDRGLWSARAGYEWTGTHDPGYLIVPQSNNRIFADLTFTPSSNAAYLPTTPASSCRMLSGHSAPEHPRRTFQRRNRFYIDTASATFRFVPGWNLGLGYSYQQNNLTTYMAFQNDSAAGYVLDEPAVPYKQITQAYWGESTYTFRQRLGLNLRLTYNSARSGMRPDVNPNDAALLGNQALISAGTFDPRISFRGAWQPATCAQPRFPA